MVPRDAAGKRWLQADLVVTALFVTACVAGAVVTDVAQWVVAPMSLALAGVGSVLFLWSYYLAVQRSRTAEIAVTQLYFVSGDVATPPVKRLLRGCLAVQVVVGIAAMAGGFVGLGQDEANWAAFAIVVPLFGFGVNGMWVARDGRFGPRILTPRSSGRRPRADVNAPENRDTTAGMEKNSSDG